MSTDFIDIARTFVLALVAVAQIYTILILRNELSRAAKVLHAMSMAMGEQSDLRRRMEDLEDEVAAGPTLKEVEIYVSDVSAAIIAASFAAWPPKTIALRILDRHLRKLFRREKADRQRSIETRSR
jgi:hypothetical protein